MYIENLALKHCNKRHIVKFGSSEQQINSELHTGLLLSKCYYTESFHYCHFVKRNIHGGRLYIIILLSFVSDGNHALTEIILNDNYC